VAEGRVRGLSVGRKVFFCWNKSLVDAVAAASASHRLALVVENVPIARDTYRLRLADPMMASLIKPGQFVMIRPGPEGLTDPLLGRPLALYDVVRDSTGKAAEIEVVYLVVGRGTAALAQRQPGERLAIWGPLGNGFGAPPAGPVVFVAGGIGQTPFLALGRWWLGKARYGEGPGGGTCQGGEAKGAGAAPQAVACSATLLYGVRTVSLLAGVDDFRRAGIEVELATDDGSSGHHGFVTELLARRIERGEHPALVVGCGPPAMLIAMARLVERYNLECQVSLENHMACGFGACFSCVVPIRQADGSTDLRRVCLDGPVIDSNLVDWARMFC
jgi:dihydroorotate dehydrogenase electron transfer subunit